MIRRVFTTKFTKVKYTKVAKEKRFALGHKIVRNSFVRNMFILLYILLYLSANAAQAYLANTKIRSYML